MARPRYYLRKHIILHEINRIHPGSILEIGFGAGDLLMTLARRGYAVSGIDYSEQAVRHVREMYPSLNVNKISDEEFVHTGKKFNVVIACEVLEHIADDAGALSRWRRLLVPGGTLILSVPAHPGMWGNNDEIHGHLRRYSRPELLLKMHRAGYTDCAVMCYGFPLANMARLIGERLMKHRMDENLSQQEKTQRSGVVYPRFAMSRLVNTATVYPFALLQRIFLRSDLGPGFVCCGRSMD
jgi:SAM-dependent methyltransferase